MKRITLIYAWLFCLALSVAAQEKVAFLLYTFHECRLKGSYSMQAHQEVR